MKFSHCAVLLLCCFFATSNAWARLQLNMPYGVTPVSQDVYRLHMAVLIICCIIALVVFSLIIYSLLMFHRSKHPVPAKFSENIYLEIIWTIIPFLILIGLAIPATHILKKIHNTEESALTIKITGRQWKWEYEYLDNSIRFYSYLSTPLDQIYQNSPPNPWFLLEVDKPMVVPVNTKVKLLITSDDVVHSWWVPMLGVKQDAIPGFINENWIEVLMPGEYRGQCGELCGVNHAFMPIVVKAVNQDEFKQWILQQQADMTKPASKQLLTPNEFLTLGKKGYERNCAMCHQFNGKGLAYSYPALQGSRVVMAPVDETITYILHGVPGAAMQAFGKILDDTTIAAIVTYIRSAWGNNSIIEQEKFSLTATPQDVAAARRNFTAS